jgi:tRNA-dihydrouridine synthase B
VSVTTELEYDLAHGTARPIAEIARSVRLDPRIPALVPGFDAPFFQAGLAGYSDGAMRLIARRHGCPFCVTEALLDRTLINGGKGRTREDPDLLAEECGTGDPDENLPGSAGGLVDHPIAGQIMGTHPDEMARGSLLLVQMGHDVIDVNLACPVKKIRRRARGGHFLAQPREAIEVLRAVREAVPRAIPVTVKLRRAFDDTEEAARNFEIVFDAAYEIGYAWATVHCRTVQQKYLGPAKWPFLVDLVKRYPDRLIFGSGDVWTVEDIFAMLDVTGVSAVSVARGCIGNPWIFRQARQMMAGLSPASPSLEEQRRALLEHFDLAVALHGERSASQQMRKFGIKFARHHADADAVRNEFIRCKSMDDWKGVIDRWYPTESAATQSTEGTRPIMDEAQPVSA